MTFLFAAADDAGSELLRREAEAAALRHRRVRVRTAYRSAHTRAPAPDVAALASRLGANAVRWAVPYARSHAGPRSQDWSVCDETAEQLRARGLTVIAELCSGELPPWLGGPCDPAFPPLFADYARAFAARYPWITHYAPVPALSSRAHAWGMEKRALDTGERAELGAFVRAVRNLALAQELAAEVILESSPESTIVVVERLLRFQPAGRDAADLAQLHNALAWLAVDLVTGVELSPAVRRILSDEGFVSSDHAFLREPRATGRRVLGLMFDAGSERRLASSGRESVARHGLGFRRLALDCFARYRLPLLHAGTGHGGTAAASWLRSQWEQVLSLRSAGVPVLGFTWAPLTDRAPRGVPLRRARAAAIRRGALFDGTGEILPVGSAYREIIAKWRAILLPVAVEKASA